MLLGSFGNNDTLQAYFNRKIINNVMNSIFVPYKQ